MNKWVKWIGLAVVFVLSIVAVTGVVLAQGPVDEDGDGVCDQCGQAIGEGLMRGWHFDQDGTSWIGRGGRMHGGTFVDEDGDGVCDSFVDEDGDGVCDNFVDEDGDGVCDNHLNGEGQQMPQRFGGRGAMGRGAAGRGRNN